MPAPRRVTTIALTILACALTIALAPAAALAARPAGHARAHAASHRQRHEHGRHEHSRRARRSARRHHPRRHGRALGHSQGAPAGSEGAVTQSQAVTRAAATIAEVLETPCQNTELMPEAGNLALVREAVLCLINRKRAENDESPLVTSAKLQEAAESHCEELIAEDYFAHISPSGETPVDRIRATGYIPNSNVGYVIGENLAWGTYQLATPQQIAEAWFASPGHLANILESQYTETGVAITPSVPASLGNGAPGATYAQEFGVIVE
ncbi:MAG TPA: CAP domain-containing protein [Solirubrobacteraceae bacterium]|nr:CAP domain-containing protein [Solirubrobacteraceae bacterium]